MQEQTMAPVAKPMTAFLEALNRFEGAQERVWALENELLAEQSQLNQLAAGLWTAYQAASVRSQELAEESFFPEEFAVGRLLVTICDGRVDVEPRAFVEAYELLRWAKKAGEEQ